MSVVMVLRATSDYQIAADGGGEDRASWLSSTAIIIILLELIIHMLKDLTDFPIWVLF